MLYVVDVAEEQEDLVGRQLVDIQVEMLHLVQVLLEHLLVEGQEAEERHVLVEIVVLLQLEMLV